MKKDLMPIASAFFFSGTQNELLRWDLTCPADEMLGSALDRDSLQDQDISYRLRTGDLVTGDHPDEVLIQCEVHPHVLLADGACVR